MKVDNELDYEYSGMKCSRVHCTWGALLGSDFCPECLERMGDTQEMSDKPDTELTESIRGNRTYPAEKELLEQLSHISHEMSDHDDQKVRIWSDCVGEIAAELGRNTGELLDCLKDMEKGDDGHAWKVARRLIEKYGEKK